MFLPDLFSVLGVFVVLRSLPFFGGGSFRRIFKVLGSFPVIIFMGLMGSFPMFC